MVAERHESAKGCRRLLLTLCLLPLLPLLARDGLAAADGAAIAMPDRYSAEVTGEVLQSGGNAVDAAVAAAFVLAVTYPEAGNIGGGGFATLWIDGDAQFLDFRERAPAAATANMYLDKAGNFLQRQALVGARATGVPGTVHGLATLHRRHGSLPWSDLLQPAISLAHNGFVVHEDLAGYAVESAAYFGKDTNFEAHFAGLTPGAVFRQPMLAKTLARLAEDPNDFYLGETAGLLLAQMRRAGGIISARDLAAYRSTWREPLIGRWRDLTVVSAPPPSSGGVALLQLLTMRDARDELFSGEAHNSPRYLHLLAEAEKRVFADRARYLGDPDFVSVPTEALLRGDYLARRAQEIEPERISAAPDVLPGLESSDTTHFSILDHAGNAVSMTYTLNWEFGCGVVVEGAGFVLNNEMDDFAAKAGVPNKFGVIGSDANAIAPGKRMLSSMTPTLGLRNGRVAFVAGTPGGSTIFTSVFQTLLNVYDFGMSAKDAVSVQRFHHQLPASTLLRHDPWPVPRDTVSALEAMGYEVQPNSWGAIGDVQLILRTVNGLQAAADPRGRGVARTLGEATVTSARDPTTPHNSDGEARQD